MVRIKWVHCPITHTLTRIEDGVAIETWGVDMHGQRRSVRVYGDKPPHRHPRIPA